jgi:hypothetical protein
MKLKTRQWLMLIATVLIVLTLAWWWMPDPRIFTAKRDIGGIEAFRKANGRLPNSLAEMGIYEDESGPVYYRKQDDQNYIVYFGLSLGESETYDSRTRKWSDY